jgi:hypothetical protein
MNSIDGKFWPFKPRFTLLAMSVVLVGLLLFVAGLRASLRWPNAQSDTVVLIGILLLSVLPIVLALIDVIIERGGAIEYGSVKIDFSRSKELGIAGIVVSPNIGVQGMPVTDSSTTQIIETLSQATAAELVVIDLEDGQAWWETRLLVLAAGAVRLRKPDKFVFVGTDAKVPHMFQGWASADDLLSSLLPAHPQYARSLQSAWAAAGQWQLVEPADAAVASAPAVGIPPNPPWLSGRLATAHAWMAFDPATGLHNELFAEQLLQSDLGAKIETQEGPRSITLTRLTELFRPILSRDRVDLTWKPERQLDVFLGSDAPYFAITIDGKYSALVSRATLSNQVLVSITKRNNQA